MTSHVAYEMLSRSAGRRTRLCHSEVAEVVTVVAVVAGRCSPGRSAFGMDAAAW